MSNPFWDFSLRSYERPAVADVCISLQDEAALDVNILLYAAWLATANQRLDLNHLEQLEAVVAPWRARVVSPLRSLRRQWRDYPEAGALRGQLQQLELAAERQQQDMMLAFYRSAASLAEACAPLAQNLALVAETMGQTAGSGRPRWHSDLEMLVSLLQPG